MGSRKWKQESTILTKYKPLFSAACTSSRIIIEDRWRLGVFGALGDWALEVRRLSQIGGLREVGGKRREEGRGRSPTEGGRK